MTLDVDIRHVQGNFTLQARFHSAGRLTALYGPSGSGKTTLINGIGGLLRPDEGQVIVNGRTLLDTRNGVFVPKHKRRIGYIFQEGRLFPHMNVRQNLLFGRWFSRNRNRTSHFNQVANLLGIAHLLDRQPATLSGGEKQRVAIGRALLSDPDLLLMDEPLASLDEARKEEIYPYIERLRDEGGIPIVLVSHSIAEIARLSTFVIVLADGHVAAIGKPSEILQRTTLFAQTGAAEAGAIIEATALRHEEAYDLTLLQVKAGTLTVPRLDIAPGAHVRGRLRARDIILSIERPEGLSALNVLPATIFSIGLADGPSVDVTLDCSGDMLVARVTRKSVERLNLVPGRSIYAVIKSIAFDTQTLAALPAHPGNV